LSNREIAAVMRIAPGSVANTLATIYSRLNITGPKGAKRVKLAVMVVQEKSMHHRVAENTEKSNITMTESGQ
jgi:DNA-binding NarL/FixJ family response regulator